MLVDVPRTTARFYEYNECKAFVFFFLRNVYKKSRDLNIQDQYINVIKMKYLLTIIIFFQTMKAV